MSHQKRLRGKVHRDDSAWCTFSLWTHFPLFTVFHHWCDGMYVNPKLARRLALLDTHESNLHWYGVNRFGREDSLDDDTLTAAQTAEFLEHEENVSDEPFPVTFRHSGWQNDRKRVQRAMKLANESHSARRRFGECGSRAWVIREKTGQRRYRVAGNYCKHRWCVPCGKARSRVVKEALQTRITGERCRFVTLTIRTKDLTLKEALAKLLDNFRRLQRTKLWTTCVDGGVAIVEVKRNKLKTDWHPHLHCVVTGRFLPQNVLSQVWKSITKDSFIVDVRAVDNPRIASNYITKYVTKPVDRSVLNHLESLAEAIEAMRGRRTIITFGQWRGTPLRPTNGPSDYELVANLQTLIDHARRGEASALYIYAQLRGLPHVRTDVDVPTYGFS